MLPYKSIEEAQESLGRGLTFAETIWIKYSANKSDYFLHCHNIIFLWIFYSIVPIPFILMEVYGYEKFKTFKVQQKEKKSFSEMFKCYKEVFLLTLYVIVPLQIISFPTIEMIGIRTGLPLPSGWEILSQIVVYFLIEDYTNYWLHRLLHTDWFYEKIHKVHHEYKSPVALAAPYAHWGLNCLGVQQNSFHFMEGLITMTTITMLVKIVKTTLPLYLPIVITFMGRIRDTDMQSKWARKHLSLMTSMVKTTRWISCFMVSLKGRSYILSLDE